MVQATKNAGLRYADKQQKKSLAAAAVHSPGIEPGTRPWQGRIIPLDYECYLQSAQISLLSSPNQATTFYSGTTLSQILSRMNDALFSFYIAS